MRRRLGVASRKLWVSASVSDCVAAYEAVNGKVKMHGPSIFAAEMLFLQQQRIDQVTLDATNRRGGFESETHAESVESNFSTLDTFAKIDEGITIVQQQNQEEGIGHLAQFVHERV